MDTAVCDTLPQPSPPVPDPVSTRINAARNRDYKQRSRRSATKTLLREVCTVKDLTFAAMQKKGLSGKDLAALARAHDQAVHRIWLLKQKPWLAAAKVDAQLKSKTKSKVQPMPMPAIGSRILTD